MERVLFGGYYGALDTTNTQYSSLVGGRRRHCDGGYPRTSGRQRSHLRMVQLRGN